MQPGTENRLRIIRSVLGTEGLSFTSLTKLMESFGGLDLIDLDSGNIPLILGRRMKSPLSHPTDAEINSDLAVMNHEGMELVALGDPEYPAILATIDDPPPFFFIRGEILPRDEMAVAVVGTRRITDYGVQATMRIAGELARRGVTIISGAADGTDTVAHRAALEAFGRTIAVIGSGLDVPYPASNDKLFDKIAENGAVISEYLPGTPPLAHNFPRRNRIISGLSLAVLVVEAPAKSGSLITASTALEQGREVFAVPGDIFSDRSTGSNHLLKEGAKPAVCADDILKELGITLPKPVSATEEQGRNMPEAASLPVSNLSPAQKKIMNHLSARPQGIDVLSIALNMPVAQVMSELSMLELLGAVRQVAGKQFVRV